jgi:hypothetical protein
MILPYVNRSTCYYLYLMPGFLSAHDPDLLPAPRVPIFPILTRQTRHLEG